MGKVGDSSSQTTGIVPQQSPGTNTCAINPATTKTLDKDLGSKIDPKPLGERKVKILGSSSTESTTESAKLVSMQKDGDTLSKR
jgi:hypothetical protein